MGVRARMAAGRAFTSQLTESDVTELITFMGETNMRDVDAAFDAAYKSIQERASLHRCVALPRHMLLTCLRQKG